LGEEVTGRNRGTRGGDDGIPDDPAVPRLHQVPLAEYQIAIRDTTRLNQLFAILSEPAPIDVVVDRVLLALSALFAADVVTLFSSEGPSTLSPLGAIGLPDEQMLTTFTSDEGSCAREAILSRSAVLCEAGGSSCRMNSQLGSLGVLSAAWLPINGDQKDIGLLLLGRCQNIPFSRSDADLLMAMAHRIGLVLERARAEEERRRLEARLRQAEKSESLARMAAAVAHHFNNKLTAVSGHLDLALEELRCGGNPGHDITRAMEAAAQAASVGQLMLAYLGQSLRTRRRLDLVTVCRDASLELLASMPDGIHLRTDWPDCDVTIRANKTDVEQILTNLVANAAESISGKGEVGISIRVMPASEIDVGRLISPVWNCEHTCCACLRISDTGSGMDPQTVHNAFDPFFTTKFLGRGLGLPVALGLVRANDGSMAVETEPGRGSTFTVYLPLAARAGVSGGADCRPE
jgi:signal transduction histidine kinase